jgi:hypothetical protein
LTLSPCRLSNAPSCCIWASASLTAPRTYERKRRKAYKGGDGDRIDAHLLLSQCRES